MNNTTLAVPDTLNHFLANARAMEAAAVEDIRDLAAGLKAHNNIKAAAMLNEYSERCNNLARSIEEAAADLDLPDVPPWRIPGRSESNLHLLGMEKAHYLMSCREVLELVLPFWQDALRYYRESAEHTEHSDVQSLANRFALVKTGDIRDLEARLVALGNVDTTSCEDLDPPHTPE